MKQEELLKVTHDVAEGLQRKLEGKITFFGKPFYEYAD